ncbi:methylmalonyl-CoA mutase subunit beta [Bosea sp. TND4EK4]|uniref:methylmalonyl-CoA mutase subunit beta n=1 Tax=Bosea sp. TND4EK4 TaxID=1907408 RepID=UPI00095504F1|nr:methylmalonyl-CoA mutase subunit beta [Bosea sp. TND4EK4]SIQ02132.1 heterodimeric methylmalonyl-CoA mutase small subunit [Bosea sp. TND4EK4]
MISAGSSDLPFLDAFPAPSQELWRAAVDKVLKGADFEKKLVGHSADGIRIEPLYEAGSGPRAVRAESGRWHVAARLDHPDPAEANALALAELEGGADMLSLAFAGAPAARGYGLVADDVAALERALDGVMLDLIRLRLDPAPQGRVNALMLAALIEKRGHAPAGLAIEFGFDPIGTLARSGSLSAPWSEVARRLAVTVRTLKERGFTGPFVTVDTRPYHEAGASEAQELGLMIGTAVVYLRALEAQGLPLEEARNAIAFTLVADTDEFMTIAKLRAARLLWARVQEACGLSAEPATIHVETAWRALTRRDPWVNLLRGTVAAFSAGVGGADSLTVLPFTAALGLPDGSARRVARNTQLVLLEEANLWRVADPAAGAGSFEGLTQALCQHGWTIFQQIEAATDQAVQGVVGALASGSIQQDIARSRTTAAKAVATRRAPITGTSEFPNLREGRVDVLPVTPVEGSKLAQRGSADRDPAEIIGALAEGGSRAEGLIPSHEAVAIEPLPSLRLAEPFEALRAEAEAAASPPAVFLATLGPIADFTARAGFARNLFEAGGIVAAGGKSFAQDGATDLDALVGAFRASGARLACLCGSDTAYAEEGAAMAEALKRAGATVWLAGRPAENEAALNQAGVTSFIFAGCDAVETLTRAQAAASA